MSDNYVISGSRRNANGSLAPSGPDLQSAPALHARRTAKRVGCMRANAQGRTSSPSTSGSTQRESNSTIRTSSYFAESNTSGITVTPQLEAMLSPGARTQIAKGAKLISISIRHFFFGKNRSGHFVPITQAAYDKIPGNHSNMFSFNSQIPSTDLATISNLLNGVLTPATPSSGTQRSGADSSHLVGETRTPTTNNQISTTTDSNQLRAHSLITDTGCGEMV